MTVGEAERLTYAELKQLSDRLAGGLLEIGLGKDEILMVQLPNVVELVVVYLTQVIPAGPVDDHAKLRALVYAALVD